MAATPIQILVKPSNPKARIANPQRGGRWLPAAGEFVVWDHYWMHHEREGDIIVAESETAPAGAAPAGAAPAGAPPAGAAPAATGTAAPAATAGSSA